MTASEVLTVALQAAALVGALIGGLWTYLRYVVERGTFPPAAFDVDAVPVGSHGGSTVVELRLTLHNVGSTTLVARDVRVDVRYLTSQDPVALRQNGSAGRGGPHGARFGQVSFPHSLRRELLGSTSTVSPAATSVPRGFRVTNDDTFVGPGVTQTYTFVTRVPYDCRFLLVWASFRYGTHLSRLQRGMTRIGRVLGLVQFSLARVAAPHTAQRVFDVVSLGAAGGEDYDPPDPSTGEGERKESR